MDGIKGKMAAMKNEHEEKETQIQDKAVQVLELKEATNKQEFDIKSLESKCKLIELEKAAKEKRLKVVEEKLKQLTNNSGQVEEARTELESSSLDGDTKLNSLEEKIKEAVQIKDEFQSKLAEVNRKYAFMTKEIERSEKMADFQERKQKALEEEIARLQSATKSKSDVGNSYDENESEDKVTALEKEFKEKELFAEAKERELKAWRLKLQSKEDEILTWNSKCAAVENELKAVQAQFDI